MKMTVEIDGKRDGHHSFHLPLPLGQSFNSSSNLGSFGSKGDGVLEIMFHWSATGIHWLSLAYLLYNHSHQPVFTHGDISGLLPLSLSPSSHPFPPYGSSLALKHSLGSLSGECSVVLILGARAHNECLHVPGLHTWWVKAEQRQPKRQPFSHSFLDTKKCISDCSTTFSVGSQEGLYFIALQNSLPRA